MCRNTRGWPKAVSPPSQATVRSSTLMISVGVAAGPSILLLRILYGGGGSYDSDATHAFNLRPRHLMPFRLLSALFAVILAVSGCAEQLVPPGPAVTPLRETADTFVMPDGMHLPYRTWLPAGSRCLRPISAASATPRCAATGPAQQHWWTMCARWQCCCASAIPTSG